MASTIPAIIMLLIIYGGGLAAVLYSLALLTRFIRGWERMAASFEEVARKLKDEDR
jgi:hypothetical protein